MPNNALHTLQLLADVTTASDDALPEAMLRVWQQTVPADYYSLMRRTGSSGIVDTWWPVDGLLGSNHRLVRRFAKLWALEDQVCTHPSAIAFLERGPGAYLRSLLEDDETWRKRLHYKIVDSPDDIHDMVSVFLETRPGTVVVFHAGSRRGNFDPAVVGPANQFAQVMHGLLVHRGGFAAPGEDRLARLTPREREILALVAEGARNAIIAATLGISSQTVRKHLENIFSKLCVENRTAAAGMFKAERSRKAT